jgi:hypothetical protein
MGDRRRLGAERSNKKSSKGAAQIEMEVEGIFTHSLCKFSEINQAPDPGYRTERPTGERSVPKRVVGQRHRTGVPAQAV